VRKVLHSRAFTAVDLPPAECYNPPSGGERRSLLCNYLPRRAQSAVSVARLAGCPQEVSAVRRLVDGSVSGSTRSVGPAPGVCIQQDFGKTS
jgi:hypothetical protein